MKYVLLLVSLLFSATTFSQDIQICGSPQKEKEARENNPSIYIEEARLKEFVHDWIANNQDLRDNAQYIIPVVFHIIHDYGYENISDDQVRDAVRIINEDYRKLNADTTTIVSEFQSIAADAKIEFRLANKTSGGQCTNGINHIHSLSTYCGGDNAKLDDWPRNMYLNVWTVKQFGNDLTGVAGYAYLPATAAPASYAPYDGVIILSSYVGSIGTGDYSTGRALTHEIGHTIGLSHPWGDTNAPGVSCNGDDGVDDTPETKGWSTCNLNGSICNPPIIENVQNYMDYSYCSRMFTLGQADVMHGTLSSSTASRNNLWKSTNLTATGTSDTLEPLCAPKADFYSNFHMTCMGTSITFHDVSWGGSEDSRSWIFEDGNPATSTESDPVVTYSTPGWKTVTLVSTNAMGSNTTMRNKYLFISDNSTAQYPLAYGDNFDDASRFTNDWLVLNPEENNSMWKRVTNVGNCVQLNNYHNIGGDIDELVTPSIDLSNTSGPVYFNFRYTCASSAYDDYGVDDGLYIYSSINCGQTWTLKSVIKGSALANAGDFSNAYTPNGNSPWVGKSIFISSALYKPNVRFKFQYKTNGQGNNIYIDDVQVQNNPVGINDPDAASFVMNVFPNPLTENSVAVIHQQQSGNLNVSIVDITGRVLKVLNSGWLNQGEHHFDLKPSDLRNAGMYFLVADDGLMISRVKVVVQ